MGRRAGQVATDKRNDSSPGSFLELLCSLFSTWCTRKTERVVDSMPRLDNREIAIRFPAGARGLSLLQSAQGDYRSHQASFSGYLGSLSLRVKRLRLKADHSPGTIYPPAISLHGMHTDTSIFYWMPLLHRTLNSGGSEDKEMRLRLEARMKIHTKNSVVHVNIFS